MDDGRGSQRSALVTGATGGIGEATARALARGGVRVGLLAREGEALQVLAREIAGWPLPCDLEDASAIFDAVDRFEAHAGGPPGLVVAAAGAFGLEPVDRITVESLDRQLNVNLRGAILTVRAVLPGLLRVGRGTVVLVGSVAGRRAFPDNAVYSATKFGLRGFHAVLLEELKGSGVRATLLEPAATDTQLWDPFDPDGDPGLPGRMQMLRAEDVAEAILYLTGQPSEIRIPYLPIEKG